MRTLKLNDVDRSRVKWSAVDLDARLGDLWRARGGALPLKLTVYNLRLVAACKRRLDRQGWVVRSQTQLKSNTIAVFMYQRYRGYRPGRG